MKIKIFSVLLAALLATSCALPKLTDQRVDYIREPQLTLINSDRPIFSWQIAPNSESQSSYQILVSSDEECRVGDMWDSGKVECGNNFAIIYEGETLQPSKSYYWRGRYWDSDGKVSRYSKVQQFTMASNEESAKSIVSDNPILKREDSPILMKQIAEGEYQFDFGRSAFGSVSFEFEAKADATLRFRVGEQLTVQGNIEQKPQGTIRYQEVLVEVKRGKRAYNIALTPDVRNTGVNAIPIPEEWGVIMPFRYVEVCDLGEENSIKNMELRRTVMYGYNEPLGRFCSSNSLLDSIWEISRYTIEATDFLGYYIDGDRERIPYEADAYLNQLSHYCIDSEYAIAKKSLEYFMSHATWPTEWLLHTIMIAYQDYIYTGDKRLIVQYYDLLKAKTLHELGREDGLISAKSSKVTPEYLLSIGFKPKAKRMEDIVDWPKAAFTKGVKEMGERDGHEMRPINTVVNCFHFLATKQMSEMAEVIGRDEDAEYFAELSKRVKQSINEKLFDSEKGIYIDGEGSEHSSLHSNMMPLAFGLVEGEEHIKSVSEFVKSRGLLCSVYGAQYLFEALYNAGEGEYALELMTNRSDRSWYNMIKVGSTMTLEAWDIKYKGNLDWNHAWGAAPANLIPRMMWGITPTKAGYMAATIKPQLADLTDSSISVPTLQGEIDGQYRAKDGVKEYKIYIPANMQATFEVVEEGVIILHDGDRCNGKTISLHSGNNIIEIR